MNVLNIKKTPAVLALIAFLSLVAYSNSFNAGFHFDDNHQIVQNPAMRSVANLPGFFVDASKASDKGSAIKGYRPLLYSSLLLSYQLSGGRPWSFHVVNFCLHLLNAFLVFVVVPAVLVKSGREDSVVPLAAALVFALHPVQTSAVTYISGRAVLLATSFYLSALLVYIKTMDSDGRTPSPAMAVVALLYLAGLLSKEFVVSLPAVMLLYSLIIRPQVPLRQRKWGVYVILGLVTLIFVWLKGIMQGHITDPDGVLGTVEYLMSEALALMTYLRVLVLPVNQNADYNLLPTAAMNAWVVLSAVLLAIAVYVLVRLARREPAAAFFGLWGLIALCPESTLIPIADIAVEYRLYLPSAGFIACAVIVLGEAIRSRRAAAALAVIVMLSMSGLTWSRNRVWADDLSLWGDTVSKSPASARARLNYGAALMDAGRYAEAVAEFRDALARSDRRHDNFGIGYDRQLLHNLRLCYDKTGDMDGAAAVFTVAARRYPLSSDDAQFAYGQLGELLLEKGRYRDAARVFEEALAGASRDPRLNFKLGAAYLGLARYREAAERLETADPSYPDSFELHDGLARAYANTGRAAESRREAAAAARCRAADGGGR